MYPILIENLFGIDGLDVTSYGFCIAMGVLAAFIVVNYIGN